MGYSWTMTPPVTDPGLLMDADLPFDSQDDAEDWMAVAFAGLVADGVQTATLIRDDNVIYAMSLLPDDGVPAVG